MCASEVPPVPMVSKAAMPNGLNSRAVCRCLTLSFAMFLTACNGMSQEKLREITAFPVANALVDNQHASKEGNQFIDKEGISDDARKFEPVDLYDKTDEFHIASQSVGIIYITYRDGSNYQCTGFFINKNEIITAHHCIPSIEEQIKNGKIISQASISMNYYNEHSNDLIKFPIGTTPKIGDKKLDYSILDSPLELVNSVNPLAISSIIPQRKALVLIHHPAGKTKRITRASCRIAGQSTQTEIQHDCDTLRGSSGAPVFSGGIVVAMHIGGPESRSSGEFNYAVKISAIEQHLGRSPSGQSGPRSTIINHMDTLSRVRPALPTIESAETARRLPQERERNVSIGQLEQEAPIVPGPVLPPADDVPDPSIQLITLRDDESNFTSPSSAYGSDDSYSSFPLPKTDPQFDASLLENPRNTSSSVPVPPKQSGAACPGYDHPFTLGANAEKKGDYATAAACYREVSDHTSFMARFNLGLLHWNGRGIPLNREEGLRQIARAADFGSPAANLFLGKLYLNGKDVPQDNCKAYRYLNVARDKNVASAAQLLQQFNLEPCVEAYPESEYPATDNSFLPQ